MKNKSWITGSRFVVVGLGVTGKAACGVLSGLDAEVIVTDTRQDVSGMKEAIAAVEAAGGIFMQKEAAARLSPAAVIVSPGVAYSHPLLEEYRHAGAEVISEIELAYRLAEGTMIAITGTNGKTTATGLTGGVLSSSYADVRVTGNIGAPLIGAVTDSRPDTVFVVEVSSYQLETCNTFRPHISAVLNVQPDHLERHGGMAEYASVKRRMIEQQEENDFSLLNADDEFTAAMSGATQAKVLMMSTEAEVKNGGFMSGGKLFARLEGREIELADSSRMLLIGDHNKLNAMCAGITGAIMRVPVEQISESIHAFKGYSHRIEKIAEKKGVLYVDDSKSTNVDSTLAAIKTFSGRPIVLLLGGDDKGLDYSLLYSAVKKSVSHIVVLGPGLKRMASELAGAGFAAVQTADDMEEAVRVAAGVAEPGDVVLLSPASSSFDLFANYEQRGEMFKNAVRAL